MFKNEELSTLFQAIRGRLSKSVADIVPPDEIEDIVQETYVRVCKFDEDHQINYPHTFMFKTAKNIALDHVKRAESVLTDAAENEDDYHFGELNGWGDEPYQRVSSNNEFELFCKSVRMLPRQCRRTFVLKKVYGYSQKEIAQQLNISERTVQKHVATGILRCGFYMNKHTDYGKKVAIKQADSSNSRGGNSRVSEHLRDED